MSESNNTEIVVTGRDNKPSLGDVVRVMGATAINPTAVVGQMIRNKRLEEAGDDLGGQSPTIGPLFRTAEAIGDGLNDRPTNGDSPLVKKFNQASGLSLAGLPVVELTPLGGVVRTVSGVVNGKETFRNKVGDFALDAAESVPVIGSIVGPIAGLLRGNTDVREVERGIKFLSENNVPGFKYNETTIDGHNVRIYVSAADTIVGSAEPWVHIDADGIKRSDPRVQARAQAVLGQAQEGIYAFTTEQNDKAIAIADGTESNPANTQAALYDRIWRAVADAGVVSAPVESGRIESTNRLVNTASTVASLVN